MPMSGRRRAGRMVPAEGCDAEPAAPGDNPASGPSPVGRAALVLLVRLMAHRRGEARRQEAGRAS